MPTYPVPVDRLRRFPLAEIRDLLSSTSHYFDDIAEFNTPQHGLRDPPRRVVIRVCRLYQESRRSVVVAFAPRHAGYPFIPWAKFHVNTGHVVARVFIHRPTIHAHPVGYPVDNPVGDR